MGTCLYRRMGVVVLFFGNVGSAKSQAAACTAPARVEAFAPELSDTRRLYRGTLSADGKSLWYFKRVSPNGEDYRIFRSQQRGAAWSAGEQVSLGAGTFSDLYPTVSDDGSRIVFSSYRPLPGADSAKHNAHLWTAEWRNGGWGEPAPIASANEPGAYHPGPLLRQDGTLRFTRIVLAGRTMMSPWNDSGFGAAELAPDPVEWRGRNGDMVMFGGVISPSGNVAVIGASRIDPQTRRPGPADTWFSVRTGAGWTTPRPLGGGVNTAADENFPTITPDGCALLFTRDYTSFHIVSLAAAIADAGPAIAPSLLSRIENFQAGYDAANRLSGVLLVAHNDSVVIRQAFGQRDPSLGEATRPETPIAVASITKTFTLVALTQLVVEGKLRLTDRVSRWVPEFPSGNEITVEHLLNHRAGIRHRVATAEEERARTSAADVVKQAARYPLVFAPGSQSSYSTAGYGVLARVMELADGKPFHEILRSRVFAPAGMTASFDATGPIPASGFAGSFLPREGFLTAAPRRDLSYLVGGGSSVSSADDLLRFANALRRNAYAGVRFENVAPRGTARWIGATAGYFAWVDVLPADGLTVVWLGNTWGTAATALQGAFPALLRGESPVPPLAPSRAASVGAAELSQFVGIYESRPGAVVPVWVDGGLRFDDNYLVPIDGGRFWLPSTSEVIRFVRDSSGTVAALERMTVSGVTRLPRIR